jgi:uncharacterized membrane protein YdbT with pleckstrin-like domain
MSIVSPDEVTLLKLRRHPIVFLQDIAVLLFLLALPPFVVFFMNVTNAQLPNDGLVPVLVILSASVYYLYITLFLFYNFFIFFLDRWIVTNQHIIDIEQKTVFNRVVSKLELERIQDVTAETKGFMQTLFNYGDVYIQTAGERERFVFKDVPAPQFAADIIVRTVDKLEKREA